MAAPATVSRNPLLEKSAGLSTGSRRARRRRAAARLRSATVHGSYPFPGQDAVRPDGRIVALELSLAAVQQQLSTLASCGYIGRGRIENGYIGLDGVDGQNGRNGQVGQDAVFPDDRLVALEQQHDALRAEHFALQARHSELEALHSKQVAELDAAASALQALMAQHGALQARHAEQLLQVSLDNSTLRDQVAEMKVQLAGAEAQSQQQQQQLLQVSAANGVLRDQLALQERLALVSLLEQQRNSEAHAEAQRQQLLLAGACFAMNVPTTNKHARKVVAEAFGFAWHSGVPHAPS